MCAAAGRTAQSQAPVLARVSGVVFDSLAMKPLPGAMVQLVRARDAARARSVESGPGGTFAFDSVDADTYLLGFYHPLLDSLGLAPPLARLEVRAGGEVRAPLALPSGNTLRLAMCGAGAVRDSIGVLLTYVRSAQDRSGKAKARVRAQWFEISVGPTGIERRTPSVEGETSEAGGAALCGVPIGTPVTVRAWSERDSSGFVELDVPASGVARRDLYIGAAEVETVTSAVVDSASDSVLVTSRVLRGSGVLRGVVRRPDGRPLDGARLSFWGSGVEVSTNANGVYQMTSLPSGTFTLEARAIGFLPQRHPVDILTGSETVADLTMESFGTYLDTVKVRAQRVYASRQVQDFEARRRRGFGTFLDEEAIEKRNPFYVSDLFRMIPGVTIAPGSFGNRIFMRGMGFQAFCVPALFIDGARVTSDDGNLDAFVNVQDIRAMEVYTRGSSVPAEFQTLQGCGSIVVWTGSRRATLDGRRERRR